MTPVTAKKEKEVSVTVNKEGASFAPTDSIYVEENFNPRKDTTPEKEFLQSIKVNGIMNPLHVCYKDRKKSGLKLVDGERRLNAAKVLGLGSVPVVNHGIMTEREALILSLTANENQKRLTRKEQFQGFRKLHHLGLEENQIAEIMAVELRFVQDALKISNKATPEVKKAVMKGVREGGMDTRVGGRVAEFPKKTQKKLVPKLVGVPREEALAEVRKVEQKIGINRPGPKAVDPPSAPKNYFAPDAAERCKLFEKELNSMLRYSRMDTAKIYVRQALMIIQSLQDKIPAVDVLNSLNPSGKYHG